MFPNISSILFIDPYNQFTIRDKMCNQSVGKPFIGDFTFSQSILFPKLVRVFPWVSRTASVAG